MFFRSLFISIASFVFLFLVAHVYNDFERQQRLDVIIITAESLRDDMVTEENCPNLLQAGSKGLRFTNYRANSGWTGTNIVSLLTGLTPFESGVHTRGQSVAPEMPIPLKQLTASGYAVKGLQPFMAMDIYQNLGISIDSYTPDPLLWLAKQKIEGNPFFLWFHYVHTHLPYTQSSDGDATSTNLPAKFSKVTMQTAVHESEADFTKEDAAFVHQLQQNNIQEFDSWFQKFWDFYHSGGLFKDTILIVTADHGDEHGERGMVGHASTTLEGHLHEEIVHIPFFIWLPPQLKLENPNLDEPASHVDIMPSLLELINIEPEQTLSGNNLFDKSDKKRIWTAMTSSGGFAEPDPASIRYYEYSLLEDHWKLRFRQYLPDMNEEIFLYNLTEDPDEEKNLASLYPERTEAARAQLLPLITGKNSRPVNTEVSSVPANTSSPQWIYPSASTQLSYNAAKGNFILKWSGTPDTPYLLEYRAGHGVNTIQGTLEVSGNSKDFGRISRRYWNTWIVANSPFDLRVKEVGGAWSSWLQVEVIP